MTQSEQEFGDKMEAMSKPPADFGTDALSKRLSQRLDMREIISRLSDIRYFMREGKHVKALTEITDLLQRLDEPLL